MNNSVVNRILLALAGLLTFSSCSFSGPGFTPTGRVERHDLIQRVTLNGGITPARQTVIQVSYEGFVRQLFVKIGDTVKKNTPLVSVSQGLQSNEAFYPLRAPYDGTVVQVFKKEGEFVSPTGTTTSGDANNRLLRVDDLSRMYIEVLVPEIDIAKLKLGMEATIRASSVPNKTYQGVIREISLAAREQDRWSRSQVQFPCRVEILKADDDLKSGMSVSLDLITGKKENVLVIGHEFIQKDGDKLFVTLKNGERREIQVGIQNEEVFEVTGGLKEGDEVRQVDFMEMITKGG